MSEGGGARITRLAPRVPPVWIQPQLKQRAGILGLDHGESPDLWFVYRGLTICEGGGARITRLAPACPPRLDTASAKAEVWVLGLHLGESPDLWLVYRGR